MGDLPFHINVVVDHSTIVDRKIRIATNVIATNHFKEEPIKNQW